MREKRDESMVKDPSELYDGRIGKGEIGMQL